MSAKTVKREKEILLPITPTAKPRGDDLTKVSLALIQMAQACILSPAAVVSTLRCALDLYTTNITRTGFDEEVITECEVMGAKLAEAILESGLIKDKSKPAIEVPASGLVGADGKPLAPSAQTLASTLQSIKDGETP